MLSDIDHKRVIGLAVDALKRRDRGEAAAHLRELIVANPHIGSTWGALSRMGVSLGEISLALTAAERHAKSVPEDLSAQLQWIQLLARYGRNAEAKHQAETLAKQRPSDPAVLHCLASCLAEMGESDAAIGSYRAAIACAGSSSVAAFSWLSFAEMKRFERGDLDMATLEGLARLLNVGESAGEPAAAIQYALGKAYEDLDEIDRAYEAYATGARMMSRVRPYIDTTGPGLMDYRADAELASNLSERGVATDRPIFVLGLPRSGTTLVEQILVSHSQVVGGAELNLFSAATVPIRGLTSADLARFVARNADGMAQVGEAYLRMLDDRFGSDGRVVDKTLNHSRYLGLIGPILPKARFIWLQRDPRAVAWSCFRTWFAQGVNWSWSFETIARYIESEQRLADHWSTVLGERILKVPYEELVCAPDDWIPRILSHVGLAHEKAVYAFHATERAVSTASFGQVRKPIYRSSIDKWRAYERYINLDC